MVLRGTKSSGQVRWLQAGNTPRRPYYRDKYNKFVAASGFAFNVLDDGRKEVPFAPTDQNLLFRDKATGHCATRVFPDGGETAGEDGVRTTWGATLPDGRRARVVSTVRLLADDFEWRGHEITLEGEAADPKVEVEICEGSCALGFDAAGPVVQNVEGGGVVARSQASGHVVGVFPVTQEEQGVTADRWFDPEKKAGVNLVYAKQVTLTRRIPLPKTNEPVRVGTVFYASPTGMGAEEIGKRVAALKEELKS
jgi:hypothetical protein